MRRHRSYIRIWAHALLLGLLIPRLLYAAPLPLKDVNHPRLIETQELALALKHPKVRVIDMRSSLHDYLKSHVRNAVYLHVETLCVPRGGIPSQAPDRIYLEKLLGEYLGISNDMWVLLYSEKTNPNATLLAWHLEALGHHRVGILNGGWEKWVFERLPITQEFPSIVPKRFAGKVIREFLAEKRWLRDRLSAKDVVIIDARFSRSYSGEEGEELRRGHIPGARNINWETTLEGDEIKTWKKREDLERLFAESGVVRDKVIVVYGQSGRESSHIYFTLKHLLGFPSVRLYNGSWTEWTSDRSLPIKTGTDP